MQFQDHFRFKIGDIVQSRASGRLKNACIPQALEIVERLVQECYGGVQAHYKVRAHTADAKNGAIGFHPDLFLFTEPEVETFNFLEWTEAVSKRTDR